MSPKDFCYWLQGHVELGGDAPTSEQWAMIKQHLELVFTKSTPPLKEAPTKVGELDLEQIRKMFPDPLKPQKFEQVDRLPWELPTVTCSVTCNNAHKPRVFC